MSEQRNNPFGICWRTARWEEIPATPLPARLREFATLEAGVLAGLQLLVLRGPEKVALSQLFPPARAEELGQAMGFLPDTPIDLHDPDTLADLGCAVCGRTWPMRLEAVEKLARRALGERETRAA